MSEDLSNDPRNSIDRGIALAVGRQDRRLRQFLADVPDAREYAYALPEPYAALLMSAEQRHSCLIVTTEVARKLRPLGLVDYASRNLTGFGRAVYRELTSGDDA